MEPRAGGMLGMPRGGTGSQRDVRVVAPQLPVEMNIAFTQTRQLCRYVFIVTRVSLG